MFFWFNGVTVYLGFDLNKYHETIAFLKENGVKFKMRMHNMNPRGRGIPVCCVPNSAFSTKYAYPNRMLSGWATCAERTDTL